MAEIKTAYGSVQTMTVTNLHSLASSATVGWQSAVVDNGTNKYLDALVQVVLDFANTAPANDQAAYVYAYSGLETTYTNPCSGSEAGVTLVAPFLVTLVGVINYNTQDEVAESQVMSVAAAFDGILPEKWGLVIINYSGAALAASGNTVKWTPITATVA